MRQLPPQINLSSKFLSGLELKFGVIFYNGSYCFCRVVTCNSNKQHPQ